jgi:hypothetical protein
VEALSTTMSSYGVARQVDRSDAKHPTVRPAVWYEITTTLTSGLTRHRPDHTRHGAAAE